MTERWQHGVMKTNCEIRRALVFSWWRDAQFVAVFKHNVIYRLDKLFASQYETKLYRNPYNDVVIVNKMSERCAKVRQRLLWSRGGPVSRPRSLNHNML